LLLVCAVRLFGRERYEDLAGRGLLIESEPSGAKVFIDGIERGKTPYSQDSIRAGKYLVRVAKEAFRDRVFTVTLDRGGRVEVTVVLEPAHGALLIEVEREGNLPFQPVITVDGRPAAEDRVTVDAGWRNVAVEAFGWERQRQSVYVEDASEQTVLFLLKPVPFSLAGAALRKNRFNPSARGALGRAEIYFEVSAWGRGRLDVVERRSGRIVYSAALGPFVSAANTAIWDGRTNSGSAADGEYSLRLSAWADNPAGQNSFTENETAASRTFALTLDSTLETEPLASGSAFPGLVFSTMPEVLAATSYQVSGEMLAGKVPFQDAWKTLPLAVSARYGIFDRFEASAAFNAAPRFDDEHTTVMGWAAQAKYMLLERGALPFAAAVSLGYGWAKKGPYTAFFMPAGAVLRVPLSLRIMEKPPLDLVLAPGALWIGEKGYPEEFAPRAEVSGGLLLRQGIAAAGVSARWDYGKEGQGPFAAALECTLLPSTFYLSASGGLWIFDGEKGGFFGVTFGVVY
jgi:hypothetical protein